MNKKFNIIGMSCSSCSNHVQTAINKLEGVIIANVNLLSNSMEVEFNENIVTAEKIIAEVKNAGYDATIFNSTDTNIIDSSLKDLKNLKNRFLVSIVFLVPLMYVAMHHMLFEMFGISVPEFIKNTLHGNENGIYFALVQILLLIPILIVNKTYFLKGFKMLFKKTPNMDSLIAIGTSAATIYGLFATAMIILGTVNQNFGLIEKYSMDLYFESAATILTLITLGKFLEAKTKTKTNEAISKLIDLTPKTAIVIRNNIETVISYDDILKDDIIIIKPGSTIPVDGIIIEGMSTIDESAITGESIPVEKNIGDEVISGTINSDGFIKFKATKVGSETTLSQIIKLVENASNSKAPIAKLADKISGVFVPIVILIAILATITWFLITLDLEFSLSIGIAVLVISCPCALGLATPVAIMVGTGVSAKNGILIKDAKSLEMLHKVDTIVLDKTGTLTEGKLKLTDLYSLSEIQTEEILKIVASIESKSEHPLALAIVNEAKEKGVELYNSSEFLAVQGRGVKASIENTNYLVGNLNFMNENSIDTSILNSYNNILFNSGKTPIFLANETEILGFALLQDTLRKTSKIALDKLKKLGLDVVVLTGDNKNSALSITEGLNIDKIISDVLPKDKANEIEKLKENGKNVAMVGDGINDSPALASADVGMAIGSGTDIAIEVADVILIKNDLLDVVTAISLSKSVMKNIKMNLFWAFFYNVIGIPLAAGLLYSSFNLKLNPMFAAAAMSLSSVCVILNALRLKFFKS